MHGYSPFGCWRKPAPNSGNKILWQEISCVRIAILPDWVWENFSEQNATFVKPASAGFLFLGHSNFSFDLVMLKNQAPESVPARESAGRP
jgi:hypothetical protein